MSITSFIFEYWNRRHLQRAGNFELVERSENVVVYAATDSWTRSAFGSRTAYVIGDQIYVRSKRAWTAAIRKHELEHVRQYRQWGLLFPVLYRLELFRVGYHRNRFEVAARQAEKVVTRTARRK